MTDDHTKQIIAKLESDDYEHHRAIRYMSAGVYTHGVFTPEELRAMADWVESRHGND